MDLGYLLRAGLGVPDYWHPWLEIQPGFSHGELGLYPVTMENKADYPGQLSSDGVPVVFWGPDGGPCPSPVNIVLYGLGNYDAFRKTGDEERRQRVEHVLHWLERNARTLGAGVGWPFEVDLPAHQVRAPWSSAITQGFALSLLLRACKMGVPGHWKELACDTWRSFGVPVEQGGVSRQVGEGVVYEECPAPELDCVFNGACHALIGLWEAWKSGLIPQAERDFDAGVAGLFPLLPRFAFGRWSLYSLSPYLGRPVLASPYYHRANGLLACVVAEMTGLNEFSEYGARWVRSGRSLARRIAISLRIGTERLLLAPAMLHHDKSKPRH